MAEALAAKPGGLTADEAARRAAEASPTTRAKVAEAAAAAARVDQALVGYFPRLTLSATYTRISPVENVVAIASCPEDPSQTCQIPASQVKGVPTLSFRSPVFLNNYALVASLDLPVSDYVLRISQNYAAESHAAEAARLDAAAESLASQTNARIAFYNWINARGQVVVANEDVLQAKAHLEDARQRLDLGFGSRADVLLLDARLATAQQAASDAAALADVAEMELRLDMGMPPGHGFEIGTDVMGPPPPASEPSLEAAYTEAARRRLEIRALDETRYSLKKTEAVARAAYAPRVDAFADAYYSNPNARQIPLQGGFFATWDAGVRVTWTINDTFTALGAGAEAKWRAAAVEQRKLALRDALRLEVARAYTDLMRTRASIDVADRGLVSAEEALRVRRELFRLGKASAADLVDAETELTRARLARLTARTGLLAAKARLQHAIGYDVK